MRVCVWFVDDGMNIDNWTLEEMELAVTEFTQWQDSLGNQEHSGVSQPAVEEDVWVDEPQRTEIPCKAIG